MKNEVIMCVSENKFLENVKKQPSGCWEWQGSRTKTNYGLFSHPGGTLAHRFSYGHFNGPIPAGLHVLHKCDNPCCVNPEHLEVGTHLKNMRDASRRGRMAIGTRAPKAKLTENDVRSVMKLRAEGWSIDPLAREFGVARNTIWLIISGRSWTHVTGLPKKPNYNKPKCLRKAKT